jgi:hypothetical protein
MSKETGEMTVREFLEEAKRLKAFEVVADPNFGLLQVLRREGFTEEQANEMKMERAWKFYLSSISDMMARMMDILCKGLERWPERAPLVEQYLKKLKEISEEGIRELEEQERRRKKRGG